MTSKAEPVADPANLDDAELGAALSANCEESRGSRLCALVHEASQRLRGEAPGTKWGGWSPLVLTRVARQGAVVVTVDGDEATAMFRERYDGGCIEHELLSPEGSASMSLADAIRVCDQLVENLEAGRVLDRRWGRRI